MTHTDTPKGNNKFYAIIPAAGKGARMGAPVNKQFLELDGVPILARTLAAFENAAIIDGIVIAGNKEEVPLLKDMCIQYGISKLIGIVEGGQTRLQSVTNALEFLTGFRVKQDLAEDVNEDPGTRIEDECEVYVLIHDGARPFVTEAVIEACAQGAALHGACICGVPVKDTIKVVDRNGLIETTVPRDGLWAVQTPQAFSLLLISAMHRKAASLNRDFTDDAQVAEYFGLDVYMTRGEYSNIKITTPDDLLHGELIVNQGKNQ
ncbi:MAG: 2-C-methyl-D-erythritol 4-phosphate cytidylyltransferase [Saccharofermentanales bacterium]